VTPEFSRFVDDAAKIGTSGRWGAVNAAIEKLAANPGLDNEWYVQLFGSLYYKVFSEYRLLKNAYAEKRESESCCKLARARRPL
jgi:hypothetical protein